MESKKLDGNIRSSLHKNDDKANLKKYFAFSIHIYERFYYDDHLHHLLSPSITPTCSTRLPWGDMGGRFFLVGAGKGGVVEVRETNEEVGGRLLYISKIVMDSNPLLNGGKFSLLIGDGRRPSFISDGPTDPRGPLEFLDGPLKALGPEVFSHFDGPGTNSRNIHFLKNFDPSSVYTVNIKTEHQLVLVSGRVDSATLIKKLVKSGKRAELWHPSPKKKLNQEQPNSNQLQFLANNFNAPQNQFMYPASTNNETDNMMSYGDYQNQNVALKDMNAGRGQNLMAATRMRNFYMDDDNFVGSGRLGHDFAYMMGREDYQGNGTGFVGLGGHDFNGMPTYEQKYLPSMIMTKKQQRYHYDHPATEMHNIYMKDPHTGSDMMTNDIFMYQPYMMDHASSTYPPYTDYHHFHAMPYPYY
ncbi:unnamed protein product [Dovyalis caffra]|uniref:Uncharacterized protein n=1 Tax=Dovyalis caffra TaxID=77055 RepID=A0AAV1S2C1_9ROSI|nr:unnamed protein product [Dovyalis caffra]